MNKNKAFNSSFKLKQFCKSFLCGAAATLWRVYSCSRYKLITPTHLMQYIKTETLNISNIKCNTFNVLHLIFEAEQHDKILER